MPVMKVGDIYICNSPVLRYHCKCFHHFNAANSLKSNRIKTGADKHRHCKRNYLSIIVMYGCKPISACLQCTDHGLDGLDV